MSFILFDNDSRDRLLPFTHTRPVADIRCGIYTMRERWEHLLQAKTYSLTQPYLQEVYPANTASDALYINGAVFATQDMVNAVRLLKKGEKLVSGAQVIAARITGSVSDIDAFHNAQETLKTKEYDGAVKYLHHLWDIFSLNDFAIRLDFELLTKDRTGGLLPHDIKVRGCEHVFVESGAVIGAGSIINAQTGPVYIGRDAEIMEGCIIRGPLALCDHAVLKMGAKIYGPTTIGNGCKVGGEVSNAVFFANSNKGHDGFIGNAVIGEWCNLGADTNCSNLKNNYDGIKLWDEQLNKSVKTDLTFCGLLMGDHSKSGINTMFNTGTIVGVSANVFGAGFPEKFIPSFCWGGYEGMTTYSFDRAMETAARMMARRNIELSEAERKMLKHVFEQTQKQRSLFAN